MMTVSELIEKLKEYPGDLPVITHGYEGGVSDLTDIESVEIVRDMNTEWYYGEHEIAYRGMETTKPKEPALLLS